MRIGKDVLCYFFFVAFVFVVGACGQDWQRAEKDAKTFADKLPNATGEVSCAKKDSDGDGYCSCTAFMEDGSGTPLECGCQRLCWNCAEGCKMVSPVKLRGGVRR